MAGAGEQLDLRVWLAGNEDAAEVTRLMIAFRDWWKRDEPNDERFTAGVARLLEDPQTEFLLASADAERTAAGVCQLRYRHGLWYDAPDCWLEDIYVEPSAQRLGLGRALVDAAVERAGERGVRRIQLDVTETNEPAVAFYRSRGFDSWSGPAGGRLLVMTRWLD
jgi:ribosomal protein S18 acetylase RimI-like enzyme